MEGLENDVILNGGLLRAMSKAKLTQVTELSKRDKQYRYEIEHSAEIAGSSFSVGLSLVSMSRLSKKLILRLGLAYMIGRYPASHIEQRFDQLQNVFPDMDIAKVVTKNELSKKELIYDFSHVSAKPKEFQGRFLVEYKGVHRQSPLGFKDMIVWIAWKHSLALSPYMYELDSAPLLQKIQHYADRAQQDGCIERMIWE